MEIKSCTGVDRETSAKALEIVTKSGANRNCSYDKEESINTSYDTHSLSSHDWSTQSISCILNSTLSVGMLEESHNEDKDNEMKE